MPTSASVITALVTGGLGATAGSIATALIQVASKHDESRATAAELVTRAAGSMVDRLDRENKALREAILLLTEVLDEVLPQIQAPGDVVATLKAAKLAAQRAV